MRILVTGAGGFIGSHVVRRLASENHEVFAVIRKPGSIQPEEATEGGVHEVALDLNDDAALRSALQSIRPGVAIHLAWYTQPAKYWNAPENLDCVAMSLKVARSLAESGCKRLIAAGTCAEYDWDYSELSEESTPLRPRGLYGTCKNALRETLEAYCRTESMQFVWMRFFYLYGPGEARERLIPSVILSLLKERSAECTSGEQVRDFLYVEDAAGAVAAVARSRETGPVNIASGQPIKVRTLVETIARILHRSDGVALGTIPHNPRDPPRLVANVSRLVHRFGWEPAFTIDGGLLRTVNWWKAHKDIK
jgi:nucleoside-diphosphate-sugar epimerase